MKQLLVKTTGMAFLGAALLLTACGGSGGSGGGGSFTPPNINETPLALTVDNQNAVALSANESMNGIAGGSSVVALSTIVDGDRSSPSAFDFATTKVLDYVKQGGAASGSLSAGVVQTTTVACDSGNVTIIFDITDPDSGAIVAGDSASITANNCVDNLDGTTVNGSYSLTIDSGSIDFDCLSGCLDVTATVSFNNFRITESGTTATIHGDMTMADSETSGTSNLSGTSLFLIAGSDAVHLTDFNINNTLITGDTATSTTVTMTVAGTQIDGSITIESTVAVEQVIGQAHPYTGTVVVTGADGATLTIDYIDQYTVNLTLDPDGPGAAAASTVTVLWANM